MTTNPAMDPLLATLLTEQIKQAQFTENAVHASNERRIRDLQKAFVALYKAMEQVFEKTDSATAMYALDRFDYTNQMALDALTKKEENY